MFFFIVKRGFLYPKLNAKCMWKKIYAYFKKYPAQGRVVEMLLTYGLRVQGKKIFCGRIELSDAKIARAAGVDRRAVVSAIETINSQKELKKIFLSLQPTCHLKESAPQMGWGVIEIIPQDASMPGILSSVSSIIAKEQISIRQAIVDDYQLSEEPKLFIVTEKTLPGRLLTQLRDAPGVKGVVTY